MGSEMCIRDRVYSPWKQVTTIHHGSQVSLFLLLTGTVLFLSERYPENSIVGVSKDTKESTVPIIIIIIIIIFNIIIIIIFIVIVIINDLKWNVYIIYNYLPKGR